MDNGQRLPRRRQLWQSPKHLAYRCSNFASTWAALAAACCGTTRRCRARPARSGGPSETRSSSLAPPPSPLPLKNNQSTVMLGTVLDDGTRHADGTPAFYEALNRLFALQEGAVHIVTPAIGETTTALVARSGLGEDILGWTVSCHRASLPCGQCPGCWKRARVLG